MLHEVLLALSGHPSPLFSRHDERQLNHEPFPLLSPSEEALLSSIGRLAELHRNLRYHTVSIAGKHPSIICRAVATAIQNTQLQRFQRKIIDVEKQILLKDAAMVGSYSIVPLASIVAEFDAWPRLMDWLWRLSCFIMPTSQGSTEVVGRQTDPCSGSQIINRLRQEAQTGYRDVEDAAIALSKAAEKAWMTQLSGWVLYGRLSMFGSKDFFIQAVTSEDERTDYQTKSDLLPRFVSEETAGSIFFIGRSLNQIRSHAELDASSRQTLAGNELSLVSIHLKYLSELTYPLLPAPFANAIGAIRLSLSQNALQHLLPLPKIQHFLRLLQEFFLLGRGEFAIALITEADEHLHSRNQKAGSISKPLSVRDLLIKEGEINALLGKTWSRLLSYLDDEDMADDMLDSARSLIHLNISSARSAPGTSRPSDSKSLPDLPKVAFNELLLPVPTSLMIDIKSPLDLFISSPEVEIYSSCNAYLLGMRRAHFRLSSLWRQSSLRREYPAPLGPPHSCSTYGRQALRRRRERGTVRGRDMRKVWATCSAAVFLLASLNAYCEGEVIQQLWADFYTWIVGGQDGEKRPPLTENNFRASTTLFPMSMASERSPVDDPDAAQHTPHDPETLATGHRRFLSALTESLILTDVVYAKTLRTLLTHSDELIAYILRLQSIQQNLDLEEDDGVVDALSNYAQEQEEVALELDRSRKRLDSDLQTLVGRLRQLDIERVGVGGLSIVGTSGDIGFHPKRVAGIDRLLMKLDFGRMVEEDGEEGKEYD